MYFLLFNTHLAAVVVEWLKRSIGPEYRTPTAVDQVQAIIVLD